jgi:hypothetical protein
MNQSHRDRLNLKQVVFPSQISRITSSWTVTIGKQNGFAAAEVIWRGEDAYVKPADENVMHTQKDFDRDVYKNPYLKVAGISCICGPINVALREPYQYPLTF